MNHKNTITTKRFRGVALWVSVALLAMSAQLIAHGGFDHVMGTVVKIENNVLTVKTAKGNVDVLLDDKTEITKNDQKALTGDLTPGTRVIVDIPEGSKDKVAHSVKVGVVGISGARAH
jgi:hypothetical protein